MFDQIVQVAKFTFALGILMWGGGAVVAEDERAGAFYIFSALYVLYLLWGHGFKAGERGARWKQKFPVENFNRGPTLAKSVPHGKTIFLKRLTTNPGEGSIMAIIHWHLALRVF